MGSTIKAEPYDMGQGPKKFEPEEQSNYKGTPHSLEVTGNVNLIAAPFR